MTERKTKPRKPLKNNAKRIRESLGETVEMASLFAGLTMAMLRRIEKGDTTVPTRCQINLAMYYGVAMTEIWPWMGLAPKERTRFDHELRGPSRKRIQQRVVARRRRAEAERAPEVPDAP